MTCQGWRWGLGWQRTRKKLGKGNELQVASQRFWDVALESGHSENRAAKEEKKSRRPAVATSCCCSSGHLHVPVAFL